MVLLLTIIFFKLASIISLNIKKTNFYLFFQSMLLFVLLLSPLLKLNSFAWIIDQAANIDSSSFFKVWLFLELVDFMDVLLSKSNKFDETKLLRSFYPLTFFCLPLSYFLFLPLLLLVVFLESAREKAFFTGALFCVFGLKIFQYDQFISSFYIGFFVLYLIIFQPQISSLFLILLLPLSLFETSLFSELEAVKMFISALLLFFIGRSLFFNFSESSRPALIGVASLGMILVQVGRAYNEIFFVSLFFLVSILMNRAILLDLSESRTKSLKELFAENQLMWFLYSVYLLGNLGLPPALGFITFSLVDFSTPLIPAVIFSLLFFILIHFLFGFQKLKLIGDPPQRDIFSKLPVKALLLGFLLIIITAYYVEAFGFLKAQSPPAQVTFSWWWVSYLVLSLSVCFFNLTSERFNLLWLERFLGYPDYKKRNQITHRKNIFKSFKRRDPFSLKDIIIRFPTQWAFFSWAISLALGLSLLFAVTYGS